MDKIAFDNDDPFPNKGVNDKKSKNVSTKTPSGPTRRSRHRDVHNAVCELANNTDSKLDQVLKCLADLKDTPSQFGDCFPDKSQPIASQKINNQYPTRNFCEIPGSENVFHDKNVETIGRFLLIEVLDFIQNSSNNGFCYNSITDCAKWIWRTIPFLSRRKIEDASDSAMKGLKDYELRTYLVRLARKLSHSNNTEELSELALKIYDHESLPCYALRLLVEC